MKITISKYTMFLSRSNEVVNVYFSDNLPDECAIFGIVKYARINVALNTQQRKSNE